jgi:hypothetical protein
MLIAQEPKEPWQSGDHSLIQCVIEVQKIPHNRLSDCSLVMLYWWKKISGGNFSPSDFVDVLANHATTRLQQTYGKIEIHQVEKV